MLYSGTVLRCAHFRCSGLGYLIILFYMEIFAAELQRDSRFCKECGAMQYVWSVYTITRRLKWDVCFWKPFEVCRCRLPLSSTSMHRVTCETVMDDLEDRLAFQQGFLAGTIPSRHTHTHTVYVCTL